MLRTGPLPILVPVVPGTPGACRRGRRARIVVCMTNTTLPGGSYRLADDLELTRFGYGAMQLAGPGVFGPPADRDEAVRVLRTVVELGITHIDTSDFYGPHVTNEVIREALHPYPEDLHLVTKVGARRDAEGGWPHAREPHELVEQVHDNLRNLGLEQLDVVNLRMGGFDAPEPAASRRSSRRSPNCSSRDSSGTSDSRR